MHRFKITLRTALLLMLVLGATLAVFRCQILLCADDLFGTELTHKLPVIESESDLVAAFNNKDCILVVLHEWSVEDTLLRKEIADEIACRGKLGRFKVFLITPVDPTVDNGESAAIYGEKKGDILLYTGRPKLHMIEVIQMSKKRKSVTNSNALTTLG